MTKNACTVNESDSKAVLTALTAALEVKDKTDYH